MLHVSSGGGVEARPGRTQAELDHTGDRDNAARTATEETEVVSMRALHRSGVRFVLSNCTDLDHLDEYNKWYDAYGADCTKPGMLVNAVRFENPGSKSTDSDARFMAIYDIVTADPGDAWPPTAEHQHRLYPDIPDFYSTVLAGTYAAVGAAQPIAEGSECTGAAMVMTDEGRALDRFVSGLMSTGLFTRASQFRLVEGFPDLPPGHLGVLETADPEPLTTYERALELSGLEEPAVRQAGCFNLKSAYP